MTTFLDGVLGAEPQLNRGGVEIGSVFVVLVCLTLVLEGSQQTIVTTTLPNTKTNKKHFLLTIAMCVCVWGGGGGWGRGPGRGGGIASRGMGGRCDGQ